MVNIYRNDFSRIFFQKWGAGPSNVAVYQGFWRAGGISWPQGDVELIRLPNPDQYGQFITVGKIPGEQGNPQLEITARYTFDASDLLKAARDGCDHSLHVHMGRCEDPRDFNRGWQKILILEKAFITDYSTDDLGSLAPGDRGVVSETVPFTGEDLYEVMPLRVAEQGVDQVDREILGIVVCDSKTCGFCGIPSDGCSIVFAVDKATVGSPGLPAEVLWTDDGGATWNEIIVDSMGLTEDPNGLACVGTLLVVISEDSESAHYAVLNDILNGTQTWTEIATGFVAEKGPLAIFSLSSAFTWIVGEGGYIYFTDDITGGVVVQDAGSQTTQDLNAVHALDQLNALAVGNSNAVVFTVNGGTTWSAVTGPAVGVNLNAAWMVSPTVWWVGTADGRLFYTQDAGVSWTEKAFPGSGAGAVHDIKFATPSVGYLAHATATPAGRILRTIDGGNSWYVLPEGTGSIPANDAITSLALCGDPNIVFGAGLADDASDGIIVKGA